ncbi:MAG: DUF4012 domain-containing protein [Chloroflexi bacterium]|nr:DUF4012 domain-containing protein [Chloroflexota bacterium]
MRLVKRLLFWLGIVLLCAELAGAAAGVLILGKQVLALRRDLTTLSQSLHTPSLAALSHTRLSALDADLNDARTRARWLQSAIERVRPLLWPALHQRAAARELQQIESGLAAVQDGASLFHGLLQTFSPLLVDPQALRSSTGILGFFEERQVQLAAALVSTVDLERELAQIKDGVLSRQLQSHLGTADKALPLAEAGLSFAITAPLVFDSSVPRHFLVVAQDPQDLRPTGGFIGSLGLLTVDQGKIDHLDYRPYPQWENVRDPSRAWPVQTPPVQRYLHFCCMDIQDSNWYPDFPTTAVVLERFFEADQPSRIDGVIAFDPAVIQALLRVTGPVKLPRLAEPVTVDNVVTLANYFEGRGSALPGLPPPALFPNKTFIVDVAQALLERWKHPSPGAVLALAKAAPALLSEKHLLLYFNNLALESSLRSMSWAGAVNAPPGDYVFLDDMSMSDNKVDTDVARSFTDRVQLLPNGGADVALTIVWTNNYPHATEAGAGGGAGIAPTTAFRDFFRLFLPAGSAVQSTAGITDAWPATTESGHLVIRGFAVIPQGGSHQITLRYHVPAAVLSARNGAVYVLHVQVQPGIPPPVYHLELLAPSGARLYGASTQLRTDHAWQIPVAGIQPATPPVAPAWDSYCTAMRLVAGLKGPYSSKRLQPPAQCAPGFEGS